MYKLVGLFGCIVIAGLLLSGFVGANPQQQNIDFDTDYISVRNCLGAAAAEDNLYFLEDKPLSMSTERFDLQNSNGDEVAIIDISSHGVKKSSAIFRYARYLSDMSQSISDIIQECR